eukprot:6198134-Pleurochrysis_carterae.AAC.2
MPSAKYFISADSSITTININMNKDNDLATAAMSVISPLRPPLRVCSRVCVHRLVDDALVQLLEREPGEHVLRQRMAPRVAELHLV